MTAHRAVARARSLLFVPADRPDRFAKAIATEADLVCIDLEDAVAPPARAQARREVLQFLAGLPAHSAVASRVGVRISSLHTADGLRDVLVLQEAAAPAAFVMLAKTESPAQLALLAAQLPQWPQIALIESAQGLHQAAAIGLSAAQEPALLQALMLGAVDLTVDLGCTLAWEPMLHARGALVAAAALAQLGCLDVPWLDIQDSEGARAEAARVAALGFSGKALIHPCQVGPVHAGLAPDDAALQRARRIVQSASADNSAIQLDGRLIDRPVVLAAQRLLRRAGQ